MYNRFVPGGGWRVGIQLGVPLVLLAFYWNVFKLLWRYGSTCLLPQPDVVCQVSGAEVALALAHALIVFFAMRLLTVVVVDQFVLPLETQDRLLRLVVQVGIPLLLVALFWDVFSSLWRFSWVCLNPVTDLECPVGGVQLLQAALTVAFALVVYGGLRFLTLVLVAQFVLPVETWTERRKVVERLQAYTSAEPGPALFVRDGQLIERHEEQQRRKGRPGVILVDSSSAVLLQTDTAFTGTHGPGVVFTEGGEQVIALDMRKQRRTARDVKAITRDGLEVTASITVTFALDSGEPQAFRDWRDPDRPPYKHNPASAFLAVYGKAVDAKYKDVSWSELPPLVAADVWRDLLIERNLESLFSKSEVGIPPLEDLQVELTARLKPPPNNGGAGSSFSRAEIASEKQDDTREYQVLAERGIRVLSVSISRLSIADELKTQRIRNWQQNWRKRARERAARTDPIIAAQREMGRVEGQAEILERTTEDLCRLLARNDLPPVKATLRYLLRATRDLNRSAVMYGAPMSFEHRMLDKLEESIANLPENGTGGQ